MKKYLSVILICFLVNSCSSDDIGISDSELIEIGNKLAEWSDNKCRIIKIKGKDVVFQGPNAGGCSPVGLEFGSVSSGPGEERVRVIQGNLRNLINGSSCNLSDLVDDILKITSDTNEEEVTRYLDCIGTVEILGGTFGPE